MKHWFSYNTFYLITLKWHLYKQIIKSTSNVIRSSIIILAICQTRKDTEDHVSSLFNDYFDTPKALWRWLNSNKKNRSLCPHYHIVTEMLLRMHSKLSHLMHFY